MVLFGKGTSLINFEFFVFLSVQCHQLRASSLRLQLCLFSFFFLNNFGCCNFMFLILLTFCLPLASVMWREREKWRQLYTNMPHFSHIFPPFFPAMSFPAISSPANPSLPLRRHKLRFYPAETESELGKQTPCSLYNWSPHSSPPSLSSPWFSGASNASPSPPKNIHFLGPWAQNHLHLYVSCFEF